MTLKKFFKYFIYSILLAFIILLINAYARGYFFNFQEEAINFGINFMFTVVLTAVNQWWFNFISKYYDWETHTVGRLIFGALGSIILTMIALFVCYIIVVLGFYQKSLEFFWANQSAEYYWLGLIITVIVSLIYHAVYFYRLSLNKKVKEQKVIARSATAQFDALKSQLDPHFLFNSLNVLVSLIEENPKAATKFTTSLSKVYRYVLEQRNKELVTINEELQFARTYVNLLKTRFENSIEVIIPNEASNPDAQVVPLSLQLLLENAVKHNVVSDTKPLLIEIFEDGDMLAIKNNLQPKQVVKRSSGVGLNNIASRYALLSNRKMSIDKQDDNFRVNIPIITEKETIMNTVENTSVEDIKLVKAKSRVADIKGLYDNAFRSAAILIFLSAVNYFTSDFPWIIFPTVGMSIGLIYNYANVYDYKIPLGKEWENRKIEQLMNDKNF
ncbi:histidine kinase [Nonlabens sp. SCSIO 43208]|uniref:histidine kinase n=1 Tax=Nonlabens TaxID=363408 RepID=UPI000A205EF1|nr:histidine kinase [Nonlabens tegetincola]ARN70995.1 histidine kinase [Nonlabens tegetincola]